MGIFKQIDLVWNGEKYSIPADQVLGAIAELEEIITFQELVAMLQASKPKLVTIARGYGVVLRYAGAKVSDEEAYAGMFSGGQAQAEAIAALNMLLMMGVPPDLLEKAAREAESEGEPVPDVILPGKYGKGGKRSSKRFTKRR